MSTTRSGEGWQGTLTTDEEPWQGDGQADGKHWYFRDDGAHRLFVVADEADADAAGVAFDMVQGFRWDESIEPAAGATTPPPPDPTAREQAAWACIARGATAARDPLARLIAGLAHSGRLPMQWVAQHAVSASGGDPIVAAWRTSRVPRAMASLVHAAGFSTARVGEALRGYGLRMVAHPGATWVALEPDAGGAGPDPARDGEIADAIRRAMPTPPTLGQLTEVLRNRRPTR